jgi:hypothetical protein
MPDSVDQFANTKGVRIPDGSSRQVSVVALQPEQREVKVKATLYYISLERPAVAEGNPDIASPAPS